MSVTSPAEREELNRLLIQTGRNDQKAFAELYKRTSSKLFGVCLRMLRDRSEAEEVLQEPTPRCGAALRALTLPKLAP
jgi:DNA-directed RNA polymerase specialized sigma24 family protein